MSFRFVGIELVPLRKIPERTELEVWCSGRDLDPGLRLERPEYLTELYYRSPELYYSMDSPVQLLWFAVYGNFVFFAVANIFKACFY